MATMGRLLGNADVATRFVGHTDADDKVIRALAQQHGGRATVARYRDGNAVLVTMRGRDHGGAWARANEAAGRMRAAYRAMRADGRIAMGRIDN